MAVWEQGEGALHVALGQTATSLGRERIPVNEAANVLRSLAGAQPDLLVEVALAKLRAYPGRSFAEQLAEMHAAAALLLAR